MLIIVYRIAVLNGNGLSGRNALSDANIVAGLEQRIQFFKNDLYGPLDLSPLNPIACFLGSRLAIGHEFIRVFFYLFYIDFVAHTKSRLNDAHIHAVCLHMKKQTGGVIIGIDLLDGSAEIAIVGRAFKFGPGGVSLGMNVGIYNK